MYEIHQSLAIILDYRDVGEKNRLFWFFTREFGLIVATAQSVRATTSKLNPYLQQYQIPVIEFVRGKESWRITNVLSVSHSIFFESSIRGKIVIAEICDLLKRLFVGEEAHEKLFDDIVEGFEKISKTFDETSIDAFRVLLMVKMLYHLGYWEQYKEVYDFHTASFSHQILEKVIHKKKELEERIKQSLYESHL